MGQSLLLLMVKLSDELDPTLMLPKESELTLVLTDKGIASFPKIRSPRNPPESLCNTAFKAEAPNGSN